MHNIESVTGHVASALTIRRRQRSSNAATEARITKLGGFNRPTGIRIKLDRVIDTESLMPGPVDIAGEDLYALREFLAELPEEAFVRPADPVEKPPRWTENDIVEEVGHSGIHYIWVRNERGTWFNQLDRATTHDAAIDDAVDGVLVVDSFTILRQASGQDL